MKAKFPTVASLKNGWQMNIDTMGVYGNYYLKREMAKGNDMALRHWTSTHFCLTDLLSIFGLKRFQR